MKATLKIKSAGSFTTVQDRGRFGFQGMGVPRSGALDRFAMRVANHLVGNAENAAVLEITVMGPTMEFLQGVDVAVTGAQMQMQLNRRPVQGWHSFRAEPGDVLSILQIQAGCRAYLAVTCGIDVPAVMGSRSTYGPGRLGGFQGRALRPGDVLFAGEGARLADLRELPSRYVPRYAPRIVLRAVAGPQDDYFDEAMETFFASEYTVTTRADRMGYRLQGPLLHRRAGRPESIISEPIMPGSVQVPADGQPIIVLVEQTAGGYIKIATVVSADLDRVAQAIPGNTVRFERVSLESAHALYREREALLEDIRQSLTGS